MIRNYLKIAWRNITKNTTFSSINIIGLALGMTVAMLIGLWIFDELTFDSYHKNIGRKGFVYQSNTINGKTKTSSAIPRALENELRSNYKDYFKSMAMCTWETDKIFKHREIALKRTGIFVQKDALDILNLNIIEGSKSALKDVNAVLISESLAKDLFKNKSSIGQIIMVDDSYSMEVKAVYKDIPDNSSFRRIHYLMPWEKYLSVNPSVQKFENNWDNSAWQLLVELNDNVVLSDLNSKIKELKFNALPNMKSYKSELFIFPMEQWHLYSGFENGVQTGGRIQYVWLFGIIGCFVLFLACINFINLSTARSEKRAKEVCVRKSIGSNRNQLIIQFLSESLLTVLMAYGVALLFVFLALEWFNELADKHIVFPFSNLNFWFFSTIIIIITALISGSYPALYLSSFNPVQVIKHRYRKGLFSGLPRKILVVLQFSFSIALIIGTLVVNQQIQYSKNRPIGYNHSRLVQIPIISNSMKVKTDILQQQLINNGAIEIMGNSSSPVTAVYSNSGGYGWEGKPADFQENFARTWVSYDYLKTIDAEFIEGRNFSREFASDSLAIVLNETAVKYMGFDKSPIGSTMTHVEKPGITYTIIGVIKDMIVESPYEQVKQSIYIFNNEKKDNFFTLKLSPNQSVSQSLVGIATAFKSLFPNLPFEYEFVDENFENKFMTEQMIANMSQIFTLLAIFISCMGLFGLAAFIVEKRTKEIGIRKVLGATISQLWILISKEFLLLITVSIFIAFPIAFFYMKKWLEGYTYRTTIGWNIFLLAGLGILAITILVTSAHTVNAANTNPVKNLKTE